MLGIEVVYVVGVEAYGEFMLFFEGFVAEQCDFDVSAH